MYNYFTNQLNFYQIEIKWQKIWNFFNVYKWDKLKLRKNIFSIDTPPPTISGALHMGHVFSYTQVDFIARFQRMVGKTIFYPIGFDNNGLPTERLIEKIKKTGFREYNKEEFIILCTKISSVVEIKFKNIYKSLGLSFDWNEEYKTISLQSKKMSQISFIDLYNKKKILRKFGPTFWDFQDKTAISQAENIDQDIIGKQYNIKFFTIFGEELVIATTRPEMLFSCVAIFYHPDDYRYEHLKNLEAIIPFSYKRAPILPDTSVNHKKGSGLVMCCTFGDAQDIKWWEKYKLNTIKLISLKGEIQDSSFMSGIKISESRKLLISKLKLNNILCNQAQIIKNIKCAERSGKVLEIIPTYQWYVKVLPYKNDLRQKNNKCYWHPQSMKNKLISWIDGLNQNWCISRQRRLGVYFPIWYSNRKKEKKIILVSKFNNLPVNPFIDLPKGYSRMDVEPETDVMDTWATSSLTPQLLSYKINQELALNKNRFNKLAPYDLRAQSHEIIRTWTFSTLVKSFFHENAMPWKNIMVSGWCLANNKFKMSKSKGNVVLPEKLIHKYGSDVIRYWASTAKLGIDTIYNNQAFKICKKLITKLFNAAKFIYFHNKNFYKDVIFIQSDIINGNIFCDLDLWLIACLYKVVQSVTNYFNSYNYYDAKVLVENFFWKEFCNTYLELVKTRIYDGHERNLQKKKSSLLTLNYVFNTLLILLSPYIPHFTEEINNLLYTKNKKILNQLNSWPKLDNLSYLVDSFNIGIDVLNIFDLVKKYKSIQQVSLKAKINYIYFGGNKLNYTILSDIKNTCNSKKIEYIKITEKSNLISCCGYYSIIDFYKKK